jgi:hypothetical protein
MVYLRASLMVVGLTTITASATASLTQDRLLLGGDNSTATTGGTISMLAIAPQLFSYCGVDVVGGDQFTKRYPSPDDCVTNCLPSTGCNAGTWTKLDGGTCYFKRFTGGNMYLVPKAGAVSFLLTGRTATSEVPYPAVNVDMPGNDLTSVRENGLGCLHLCYLNEKCHAYTYTSYNGGTCWLKTKTSAYVALPGSDSGFVPRAHNAAACLPYV